MPRIAIDFEKLRHLECGLGQFCLEVGRELLARRREDEQFHFYAPANRAGLFADQHVECKPVRRYEKTCFMRPLRFLTGGVIPGRRYDLWHMTHQGSKYEPWHAHTPVLLTIHDLNFLRKKKSQAVLRELQALQRKVDRATRVTAISEFVAGEVREHLNLRGKPLDVIYNGAADIGERPVRPLKAAQGGRFLFSLGCFLEKKNFHTLIHTMPHLPDLRLVIAGQNATPYGTFVAREAQRLGVADRVILPGPIRDEERNWCYQNCEALVFPSLSEGFGLPPVEAMSVGKPVFLSRNTSLPEIGGDVAFYWQHLQPKSMAKVVRQGLEKAAATPELADRLRERSARFRWADAASGYLEIYRDMLVQNEHVSNTQRAA